MSLHLDSCTDTLPGDKLWDTWRFFVALAWELGPGTYELKISDTQWLELTEIA